jgi:hypothetical protein
VSWFDISDAEGVELDGDRDEECPFDDESTVVSEPDPWTLAAMSGEGGDMGDEDKTADDRMIEDIGAWIAGASVNALRHAYFAIEREVERRRDEVAREAKQLEAFAKPVRATRKDAGMKRDEYKAQKGAA